MEIRILAVCFVVFIMLGCGSKRRLLFPNGVVVEGGTVAAVDAEIPLTYYPYRGFTGEISDSVFSRFKVLQEAKARKIDFTIMSEYEQSQLRNTPVTGIMFDPGRVDPVRGSAEDSTRMFSFVAERYPTCRLMPGETLEHGEAKSWDLMDQKDGVRVGRLMLTKTGGRGYYLELFLW